MALGSSRTRLSIITPSMGDRPEYLRQCGTSIDMVRAAGVDVEWIIASPAVPEVGTEHVHVPLARAVTPAVARNAALGAVDTQWVSTLDDDFLAPGFVEVAMRTVGSRDVCFAVSQDFYPDGSTAVWEGQLEPGVYGRERYSAIVSRYPVAVRPSTMVVRTGLLAGVGGWDESLVQAEDIDCALRVARHGGFHMEGVVTHNYRKHARQMTRRKEVADADAAILRHVYRSNGVTTTP